MACISGTVSMGGQPAVRATRLVAPSAPTILSACSSSRVPAVSVSRRSPLELGPSPRKRVSKDNLAPAAWASRASAGIKRERSTMRSGCESAICAERPSVKSSKRRISLTTLSRAAEPSWLRKWLVTIRVRAGGSKHGLDSRTRTERPPRASAAAVYRPAAEPPTTITSPFSRRGRGSLLVFDTVWYAPMTRDVGRCTANTARKIVSLLLSGLGELSVMWNGTPRQSIAKRRVVAKKQRQNATDGCKSWTSKTS